LHRGRVCVRRHAHSSAVTEHTQYPCCRGGL